MEPARWTPAAPAHLYSVSIGSPVFPGRVAVGLAGTSAVFLLATATLLATTGLLALRAKTLRAGARCAASARA